MIEKALARVVAILGRGSPTDWIIVAVKKAVAIEAETAFSAVPGFNATAVRADQFQVGGGWRRFLLFTSRDVRLACAEPGLGMVSSIRFSGETVDQITVVRFGEQAFSLGASLFHRVADSDLYVRLERKGPLPEGVRTLLGLA
ncbi:MAG: hypothetical protein HYT76_00685 [Deltaproteobacteria bacterium]|nr:hypothetical protein [Deltaproteobacteria bacterium]